MGYTEAAKTADITEGQMKAVNIGGKEILVVNYGGKYYAVAGRCSHMGGELAKGKLEGNIVTCPRHGARFDVTSGQCLNGPKIGPFKKKSDDIAAYEVAVEGDSVKVNLP